MSLHDIAVGLDGSPSSADALRWAVGLADASSATVRVISSWQMPLIASMPSMIGGLPSAAFMANQCSEHLADSLESAGVGADFPSEVREGNPGAVLVTESESADLVVLGRTGSGRRRGLARFAEVVLGSTARHVIHHAKGPVAIVPVKELWVDNPVVVVGVDGSPASHAALTWAIANLPEATEIHALRAIPSYIEGLLALEAGVVDRIIEASTAELAASIAASLAECDPAAAERVHSHVVVENARDALVEPGFDIDLVVVGERGRSGVAGRLLGSVSDHVVRHATCPVIVIPAPQEANNGH